DQENVEFLLNISPEKHRSKVRLFIDFAGGASMPFVPDPYYGGRAGFEKVLDLFEETSAGFIAQLSDESD
ncbi:MAG: low molecular weight phosphotyrosine protein phosphatase, partial [Gammaproteobacteria bacterium]